MAEPLTIVSLSLPIPWEGLGLASRWRAGGTVVAEGDIGWSWSDAATRFEVPDCGPIAGEPIDGWGLDHVVLLVSGLDSAVEEMGASGVEPSLRMEVKGRPTAFFRVGPVLEVIQSPVRAPALYGVALVAEEPLEVLALRWRNVSDPKPALQPGRRIFTVRDTEAGLAVMSPDRAAFSTSKIEDRRS